ncbi:hypothetical protein F5X68DRAFT_275066 [Plectosphaerella plurivora]|uniref:Uncharacterized protein n=1 Tax=Plectosphaerella plurivora TaxID=936078 RepID=A0A9P8VD27_9PEZI|nr:hypothetical protein F5X68DRAFT_275066 [Plectosphaerella plurivora]
MRSAVITSFLVSSALALVAPRAEDDSSFTIQSFDVPGTSENQGIVVPKGAPEGIFSVSISADGVAHHTRVESFEEATDPLVTRDDEHDESSFASLTERQSGGWEHHCGNGRNLDKANLDIVVGWMKIACGTYRGRLGLEIKPHQRFYYNLGGVVHYFCNFDSVWHMCKDYEIEEHLQRRVSQKCGAYKPGWASWGNYRISIGQQGVGSDMYFCGQYN